MRIFTKLAGLKQVSNILSNIINGIFVKEITLGLYTLQKEKWILLSFCGLTLLDFFLLHTNQRSSQTIASILLLLCPTLLFLEYKPLSQYPKCMLYLFIFIFIYLIYQFMNFTYFPLSSISFSKYRDGTFLLLLPFSTLLFSKLQLTLKNVFWIFFIACILSLSPIFRDLLQNGTRGNLSAQPIYWGNICLTTGIITFILSQAWADRTYKFLGFLGLTCCLLASLWSETRGGWICLPIVLIAFLLLRVLSSKQLLVIVCFLIMAFLFLSGVQDKVHHTINQLSQIDTYKEAPHTQERSSIQQRFDMWYFALKYPPKNRLIGGGGGYFNHKLQQVNDSTGQYNAIKHHANPHSEYLEILTSKGLIGFTLFIIVLLCALTVFRSHIQAREQKMAAYAGCFLIFLFSIYSFSEAFFTAKYPLVYFSLSFSLLASQMMNDAPTKDTLE